MTDPLSINLTAMFNEYDWALEAARRMVGETYDGHTITAVARVEGGIEYTFHNGTTHVSPTD
jgi:hypothetical protein